LGIQDRAASFETRTATVEALRKINKEALAYWTRLQGEAEKAVQSGAGGHH
jgi:hypothetical protein